MASMSSIGERVFRWTVRHKWEYRLIVTAAYLWLIYSQVTVEDFGPWNVVLLGSYVAFLGLFGFQWWRQDVLDEFEWRAREAIGSDANLLILATVHQLRTSSVWRLNRIMRRHDIMGTPILDLPPEAKELRLILEDLTK